MIESSSVVVESPFVENKSATDLIKVNLFIKILLLFFVIIILLLIQKKCFTHLPGQLLHELGQLSLTVPTTGEHADGRSESHPYVAELA